MVGSSSSAGGLMAPGGVDWRSKLQNLSTAIVQSPNAMPLRADDEVLPQRSRLSETPRAVRWDTVQVRGGSCGLGHKQVSAFGQWVSLQVRGGPLCAAALCGDGA